MVLRGLDRLLIKTCVFLARPDPLTIKKLPRWDESAPFAYQKSSPFAFFGQWEAPGNEWLIAPVVREGGGILGEPAVVEVAVKDLKELKDARVVKAVDIAWEAAPVLGS